EIWNLVFMQYNRFADGSTQPLPKPSVDTGMGLERLAAVMQGKHNNFETDIFSNIIKEILNLSKAKDESSVAVRVIADHIRAAAFLITDGVVPSNEGRGYVLRRIIRRAVRFANKLSVKGPFLSKLVAVLVKEMGAAYPKLAQSQKLIERMLQHEEQQFSVTLAQGLRTLEQEIDKLKGDSIPGELVFRLYDTYGFPIDITLDIAKERGFSVDEQALTKEMLQQREQSKKSSHFTTDYTKEPQFKGKTEFVGDTILSSEAKIIGLVTDGEEITEMKAGEKGRVILDRTTFYAEAGGQIGDSGDIYTDNAHFHVAETLKHGDIYMHYGYLQSGILKQGTKVEARVSDKRRSTTANHSAAHLLHAALQQILGSHVTQKGSFVDAKRLRFDFSHFESITSNQIKEIEELVNAKIRANIPVIKEIMSLDEARKAGAIALFGEKYTEKVSVISIRDFSKELCCGTHVKATGEIGLFKIITESAIAAGIRRIEAITAEHAFTYLEKKDNQLKNISILLKTEPENVVTKVAQVLENIRAQEKELQQLKSKLVTSNSNELLEQAVEIDGIKVLAIKLANVDMNTLRSTIDQLKMKLGSAVIVLATVSDNKIQLVAGVSKDCSNKVDAGKLMGYVASQVNGKGGGKADMAQGGG
ncbi:MAG: alanine--tRNA ligase, partial [Gammaproteobacteria bacterium]|nr:alanine--tRNA ligase [Gammaproteobacteria bacterium]